MSERELTPAEINQMNYASAPAELEPQVESESSDEDIVLHQNPPAPTQQEAAHAKSWRELRQQKEKAEQERDELLMYMKYQQNQPQNIQNNQQQAAVDDDDLGIGSDDYAEGKHIKSVNKNVKKLQKELHDYKEAMAEMTLRTRYTDFDDVVNPENLKKLKKMYPEMAESIHYNPDLYKKSLAAYNTIKSLGINKNEDYNEYDKYKVQQNAAKPRPLASVSPQQGDSPLSKANAFANGLTEELSKNLYREMVESMKKAR